jgi:hypothetical protein
VIGTPVAPTGVSATAGTGSATVFWTKSSTDNGSAITAYIVTSYVGGVENNYAFSASATSGVVTGLTSGTVYTFRVAAQNARGIGPSSAQSNAVTPT